MTEQAVYQIAREAGFPHEQAVRMVAIAWKESGGNPRAFNGVGPDESYGLWQINMIGRLGDERRRQFGIRNEDLYDPATNARLAYALWAGNDANLVRHWGLNVEPYASRYRAELARVTPMFGGVGNDGSFAGGLGAPAAPSLDSLFAGSIWQRDDVLAAAALLGGYLLVETVILPLLAPNDL